MNSNFADDRERYLDGVALYGPRSDGPGLLMQAAEFMEQYDFAEVSDLIYNVNIDEDEGRLVVKFEVETIEPFERAATIVEWLRPGVLRCVVPRPFGSTGLKLAAGAMSRSVCRSIAAVRLSPLYDDEATELLVFMGDF